AACSQVLQPLLEDGLAAPTSWWLPAIVADARGNSATAFRLLEPLVDTLHRDDFVLIAHDSDRFPHLVSLAVRAGKVDRAMVIAPHAQRLADQNPTTTLFAGVAAHCRAIVEPDDGELSHAVGILRNCNRPLALANALEDLGTERMQSDREGSADALG